MTETNSTCKWTNLAIAALAISSAEPNTIHMKYMGPSLLKGSVLTSSTSSKIAHLPGEARSWEEARIMRIKALRGKYKANLTSSEEFAMQKREEISLEG